MSAWIWVPIGLAAWTAVSIILGLVIGPVLARSSQGLQPPADSSEEEQ